MKRFRYFLVLLLSMVCCSLMMVAPVANAATKVSLNKHTTKAGYTRLGIHQVVPMVAN